MTLRLAVRAMLVADGKLLIVNAYPGGASDLWCAPGGGVERGRSLHENLIREVREETGLSVAVGALALVNEFHDPRHHFHQVEMFFRCETRDLMPAIWRDPEGVVSRRRWVTEAEARGLRIKPDSLIDVAFGPPGEARYDPLERIVS